MLWDGFWGILEVLVVGSKREVDSQTGADAAFFSTLYAQYSIIISLRCWIVVKERKPIRARRGGGGGVWRGGEGGVEGGLENLVFGVWG